MKEVVIVEYLRTAQSRSRPNDPARDWFCKMRADELLAKLLPEAIKRVGIEPEEIDDFLVGCATGVSEQWAYGGRVPIFLANLPETIPAKAVDQQCGSAMAGLHIGFMEIAMDFADIVMVGGMEHMTRVPMGGALIDRGAIVPNMTLFMDPAYQHWDMMTAMTMGLTAEKLLAQTDFTRDDMDQWAVRSHQLAAKAQKDGFFDGEIIQSTHLHQALVDDLRVSGFNIFGYAVDPRTAAENLGGRMYLWGNISPMLMLNGSKEEVKQAAFTALEAMAPCGGFMLGDGANVCPGTPLENLAALTEASQEYGLPSHYRTRT